MIVRWVVNFSLLDGTHFVWLVALAMPANNPINFYLINLNIIKYHVLSSNTDEDR